jgi:hypothetical protein
VAAGAVKVVELPLQMVDVPVMTAFNAGLIFTEKPYTASTYKRLKVPLQGSVKTVLVAATEKLLLPTAAACTMAREPDA